MPWALKYKIADTAAEYEAIHRLNHRTFAEEIPQHAADPAGRLVDRFHPENTYALCLDGAAVVGMVAGRSARPFSLDAKLDDLDSHLPAGRRPVEIRLLAVEPAYRNSTVVAGLLALIAGHFGERGRDLAVISGTTRALGMYRRMGFVPFGPLTGPPGAQYQPMYLTLEDARRRWAGFAGFPAAAPANFLPGPVALAPEVVAAFARPPAHHRSAEFIDTVRALHARLARLVNARHAQVLLGSGTLANDAVAYQLHGGGVVLANGEFGERLVDHASRAGLDFSVVSAEWGRPFSPDQLDAAVRQAAGGWLWTVHCETSTGVQVDLDGLTRRCVEAGVRLCVDCISSIGAVPLDLSSVHLASGSSGKALGAYPGLAVVFCRELPRPEPDRIPRYLDLGTYAEADGVAFTQSSNLVHALDTALRIADWPDRYASLARGSAWLRGRLRRLGFDVLAPDGHTAPGICTVALPPEVDSGLVGARMAAAGYLLAYESGYLTQRNWLQISLMGQWTWPSLRVLPAALRGAVPSRAGPSRAGPGRAGPCRAGPCRAGPCRSRGPPGNSARHDDRSGG